MAAKSLETCGEAHERDEEHLPLREVSVLLAPAAEATELGEEDLLCFVREVRRRIWQERYEEAVRACSDRQDSQQA